MQFKDLPKFSEKPFSNNEELFIYTEKVNEFNWKSFIIDWISKNHKEPIKGNERELFEFIFQKEVIQGGMIEIDYREISEKLNMSLTTTFKFIGKLCERKIIAKSIDPKLYWINPAIFTPISQQRALVIKLKMQKL